MLLQHAFGTHENMWNVLFPPPPSSLQFRFRSFLPSSLWLLVMRCGWAETRPHVSAGFAAASSAPIISSLPWHHAQRQPAARHLTGASHARTPDTVTARTKSSNFISEYTIPRQICVYKKPHRGSPRAWSVYWCLWGDTKSRFAGENRTDLLGWRSNDLIGRME